MTTTILSARDHLHAAIERLGEHLRQSDFATSARRRVTQYEVEHPHLLENPVRYFAFLMCAIPIWASLQIDPLLLRPTIQAFVTDIAGWPGQDIDDWTMRVVYTQLGLIVVTSFFAHNHKRGGWLRVLGFVLAGVIPVVGLATGLESVAVNRELERVTAEGAAGNSAATVSLALAGLGLYSVVTGILVWIVGPRLPQGLVELSQLGHYWYLRLAAKSAATAPDTTMQEVDAHIQEAARVGRRFWDRGTSVLNAHDLANAVLKTRIETLGLSAEFNLLTTTPVQPTGATMPGAASATT